MNQLSWFLYLADIIPNIGVAATILLVIVLIAGGPLMGGWSYAWVEGEIKARPWYGTFFCTILTLTVISVLVPSKETIYLIAGSQAGEYVVNTPQAQEILSDIHQIIRLQLQEMQGE